MLSSRARASSRAFPFFLPSISSSCSLSRHRLSSCLADTKAVSMMLSPRGQCPRQTNSIAALELIQRERREAASHERAFGGLSADINPHLEEESSRVLLSDINAETKRFNMYIHIIDNFAILNNIMQEKKKNEAIIK